MRIGIIGAGAIGCIVGGLLSRAGGDVTVVDRWPESVEAMKRRRPAGSLRIVAVAVGVLAASGYAAAQAGLEAHHRSALERFLNASRMSAVIKHLGIPTSITAAAVNGWGFERWALDVTKIVPHLDARALEDQILKIHARYLTADQATQAARFYESPEGKRVLADLLGPGLPATDPLIRAQLPAPTEADRRTFHAFSESGLGVHVKAVTPKINDELLRAVAGAADLAVERYVAANGLPNHRLGPPPPGDGR